MLPLRFLKYNVKRVQGIADFKGTETRQLPVLYVYKDKNFLKDCSLLLYKKKLLALSMCRLCLSRDTLK